MIADFLLAAGALSAGLYCLILSRRLARFSQLESGMGGAIAVLSVQVDEMTRALEGARTAAGDSVAALDGRTRRAEDVAERLDLILAAMHDLPTPPSAAGPVAPRRRLRRRARERRGAEPHLAEVAA